MKRKFCRYCRIKTKRNKKGECINCLVRLENEKKNFNNIENNT